MKVSQVTSTAIVMLMGCAAQAQETGARSAWNAQDAVLAEVVVTAQKRDESLQDVPSSIAVVTGTTLEENHIREFEELRYLMPGLDMQERSPATATIDLRGFQNVASHLRVEPVVEVYWNGVAVSPTAALGALFDVEQVEFLRGPQGSLQGRPAPSGVILLRTRAPDLDALEGTAKVSFSDDGDYETEGAISVPLIDDALAVRVAAITTEDDGPSSYRNVHTGRDAKHRNKAARLSGLWAPGGAFRASIVAEYNERTFVEATTPIGNGVHGVIDGYDVAYTIADYQDYERIFSRGAVTLEWEIADRWLLVSITGVDRTKELIANNLDFEDTLVRGLSDGLDNRFGGHTHRWMQELRLQSASGGAWDSLFGLYYLDAKYEQLSDVDLTGIAPGNHRYTVVEDQQEQLGLFTQHGFRITDKLRAQAGLRWQQYKDVRHADTYQLPQFTLLPGLGFPRTSSETDAPTWSAQVSYDLLEDVMAYASYQRSYRPAGRLASRMRTFDPSVLTYPEENGDSIEVGMKATGWDGRVQANLNLYRQDFDAFIGLVTGIATDGGAAATAPNGVWDGTAVDTRFGSYPTSTPLVAEGAELEWQAAVTSRLRLGGAAAYNMVKYGDGAIVPCAIPNGSGGFLFPGPPAVFSTCEVSGQKADIANWSLALTAEYRETDLLDWADFYARALYSRRGDRRARLDLLNPDVPAFGILNFTTGLRARNGAWDFGMWIKNLTDKHGVIDRSIANYSTNYATVTLIPERSFGVSASYNFEL